MLEKNSSQTQLISECVTQDLHAPNFSYNLRNYIKKILVDAADSKSCSERSVGSIPTLGTIPKSTP